MLIRARNPRTTDDGPLRKTEYSPNEISILYFNTVKKKKKKTDVGRYILLFCSMCPAKFFPKNLYLQLCTYTYMGGRFIKYYCHSYACLNIIRLRSGAFCIIQIFSVHLCAPYNTLICHHKFKKPFVLRLCKHGLIGSPFWPNCGLRI